MGAPANSLVFETGELAAAVRDVIGAVQRRNTIAILSNVRIDAGTNCEVRLTTTDLDVMVVRTLKAVSVDTASSFTIDAQRLHEVLGSFEKGSRTSIDLGEGAAVVKSGRARLRFATLPATDFPMIEQKHEEARFQIDAKALLRGISTVRHAVSTEEVRYYMCGIFWHVRDGHLRYAASDGYRLARYIDDIPDGAAEMPDVILGTACVDLARQAAEQRDCAIDVTIGDNKVSFEAGNFRLLAKVVDGTYPDYERVIPSTPPLMAVVDRDGLAAAASRVSVALNEKTRAARLTFNSSSLTLSANSQQHGDAIDELPCEFDGTGDFAVGFNLRYLRDALAALEVDTVQFGLTDARAPTTLTSVTESGLLLVLMPMNA